MYDSQIIQKFLQERQSRTTSDLDVFLQRHPYITKQDANTIRQAVATGNMQKLYDLPVMDRVIRDHFGDNLPDALAKKILLSFKNPNEFIKNPNVTKIRVRDGVSGAYLGGDDDLAKRIFDSVDDVRRQTGLFIPVGNSEAILHALSDGSLPEKNRKEIEEKPSRVYGVHFGPSLYYHNISSANTTPNIAYYPDIFKNNRLFNLIHSSERNTNQPIANDEYSHIVAAPESADTYEQRDAYNGYNINPKLFNWKTLSAIPHEITHASTIRQQYYSKDPNTGNYERVEPSKATNLFNNAIRGIFPAKSYTTYQPGWGPKPFWRSIGKHMSTNKDGSQTWQFNNYFYDSSHPDDKFANAAEADRATASIMYRAAKLYENKYGRGTWNSSNDQIRNEGIKLAIDEADVPNLPEIPINIKANLFSKRTGLEWNQRNYPVIDQNRATNLMRVDPKEYIGRAVERTQFTMGMPTSSLEETQKYIISGNIKKKLPQYMQKNIKYPYKPGEIRYGQHFSLNNDDKYSPYERQIAKTANIAGLQKAANIR